MAFTGFDAPFFDFLAELKRNNTREWFASHKDDFVTTVETPAREFVRAFEPHLKAISPRFVANSARLGGSMYRIYRDTRFSPAKTPFRTHIGLRFWHDTKDLESRPIFYLHLERDNLFGGGGLYHPAPAVLRQVRLKIASAPREWQRVLDAGLPIVGETLKRIPAGFPADHPFAEDLRRKSHLVMTTFTEGDVASPDFVERYADACRALTPLMQFLVSAQELRW